MPVDLDQPMTQADFGALVGVTQPAISAMVDKMVLQHGQTGREWLLAYCQRLRDQAAGRVGAIDGGLDLAQERAALAREQRIGHELKNAVARGEYASITLLAEVLAGASQAVAERFAHLGPSIARVMPDLPPAVTDQLMAAIAEARNGWIKDTAELVKRRVLQTDDDMDGFDADDA